MWRNALNPPSISVITPVYNALRFFPETIQSVLNQTCKDWEWIVADDGSTDGSLALAQQLNDPRIRVVRHPGGINRGQAASRNLAIQHARAAILAFVDADDVWTPEKLALDLATFDRFPEASLIYSKLIFWESWNGGADRTADHAVAPDTLIAPPDLLTALIRDLYTFRSQFPAPSCVAVRRDACPDGEDFFEPGLRGYEDVAFLTRVLLRNSAVACSDVRMYHRRGYQSFSANEDANHLANWNAIVGWMESYIGVSNATVRESIATAAKIVQESRDRQEGVANVARRTLPERVREWLGRRR
jgi:glycosyltransferase involved in cell wall biosynthesis